MMSELHVPTGSMAAFRFAAIPAEAIARQRMLALFGFALLALALVTLVPLTFDLRLVNGEPVWLKPFKFFVSLGLFSLTTGWFFGYLRPDYRSHWTARLVVIAIVSMSTFELAYIVLQSLRGLPSHFFNEDPFHRVMYGLMGYGALILTGSQLLMAIVLLRFARTDLPRPFLNAVVAGLVLTWALGTITGGVMGVLEQRYANGAMPMATVPVLGWSLTGGDWRPAHFLALHAQQAFPIAGFWLARQAPDVARNGLLAFTAFYTALTLTMLAAATVGLPFQILSYGAASY